MIPFALLLNLSLSEKEHRGRQTEANSAELGQSILTPKVVFSRRREPLQPVNNQA